MNYKPLIISFPFLLAQQSFSLDNMEELEKKFLEAIHHPESMPFEEVLRKNDLPIVEKMPLTFGSKTIIQHSADPIHLIDGLSVNDGIFVFFKRPPHDKWTELLYLDKQGNELLSPILIQSGKSVFQARTDTLIFEPASLNFKGTPQSYHDELPNKRSWILTKDGRVLAFVFDNISFSLAQAEQKGISDHEVITLFRKLSRILTNPQDALYQPERAKELRSLLLKKFQQEEEVQKKRRQQKEEQRHTLEEKLSPGYGMPRYASSRFNKWLSVLNPGKQFKDFNAYYASLNLPECSGNLVLPNIHQGAVTSGWFRNIWPGKVEVRSEAPNGLVVLLHPKEGKQRDTEIVVMIGCTQSRSLAMRTLHQLSLLPFDPDLPGQTFDTAAEKIVFNPFKLGDYCLGRKTTVGNFGGIIPGSERSAVYFLRGNTVVMAASMDLSVPVLGLAKKIDAALQVKNNSPRNK